MGTDDPEMTKMGHCRKLRIFDKTPANRHIRNNVANSRVFVRPQYSTPPHKMPAKWHICERLGGVDKIGKMARVTLIGYK